MEEQRKAEIEKKKKHSLTQLCLLNAIIVSQYLCNTT